MIKSRTISLGTNFSDYTKMSLPVTNKLIHLVERPNIQKILNDESIGTYDDWSTAKGKTIFKVWQRHGDPDRKRPEEFQRRSHFPKLHEGKHETNHHPSSKVEDFIQHLLQKNTDHTLENSQMSIDHTQTCMSCEDKLHTSATLVTMTGTSKYHLVCITLPSCPHNPCEVCPQRMLTKKDLNLFGIRTQKNLYFTNCERWFVLNLFCGKLYVFIVRYRGFIMRPYCWTHFVPSSFRVHTTQLSWICHLRFCLL